MRRPSGGELDGWLLKAPACTIHTYGFRRAYLQIEMRTSAFQTEVLLLVFMNLFVTDQPLCS